MEQIKTNEPNHPTDYRLVRLIDGSILIGTIECDERYMKIQNPLELTTIPRMSKHGLKEDTTLCRWMPYSTDTEFVFTKDKIIVISTADAGLAHFYEVMLEKLETEATQIKPHLSAREIDEILDMAERMSEFEREEEMNDLIGGYVIDSKTCH